MALKKLIINLLMGWYVKLVGFEPDYTVEIIRRQNLIIRNISACYNYEQLREMEERYIPLYMEVPFPYHHVENALAILRSHIAWRKKELSKAFKNQSK